METSQKPDATVAPGAEATNRDAKLDAVLGAINKLADSFESRASQSSAQAMAAAQSTAIEKTEKAASADEKDAIIKQMQAQLAQYKADTEDLRKSMNLRQSGLSLGEFSATLTEAAHLPAEKTKALYGRLGQKFATASNDWNRDFADRSPLDVLMRGALVSKDVTIRPAAGVPFTVRTTAPLFTADDDVLKDAHEANDAAYLWHLVQMVKGTGMSWSQCPFMPRLKNAMARLGSVLQKAGAMDTTDTANWIPTGFSPMLIQVYELDRSLSRLIPTVQMPQNPWNMPALLTLPTFYKITESVDQPESETTGAYPSTVLNDGVVAMQLHNFGVRIPFSLEIEDDSIIAMAPAIVEATGKAWRKGEEDAIQNSDSQGTHQDSDVTSASDHRKTWDGLRRMAIANSYTSSAAGAVNDATVLATPRGNMGRFGVRATDVVAVCGPALHAQLLTLKTAGGIPLVIGGWNAAGMPNATTMGEVPSLGGSPLVVAEDMRENLNALGVYDGVTTTKKGMLWFNRQGFALGYRNLAPEVYTFQNEKTLQRTIVVRVRREFEDALAIAGNHTVEFVYNI